MSYSELVDWMFNLERFGIKLGLDNMREFSERIGCPHRDFRSVHVTGTNGKGSVCNFVSEMLRQHGLKVGLYTSPHLVDFRERIKVGGRMIPEGEVVRLIEDLRTVMEEMAAEGREKQLTFFEFTTGLAFEHFSRKGVDYVVAEVGMGGRLDATNLLEPDVAAITRIGLEHTDYLGSTLEEIAREKAGIIKEGARLVTCERDPGILALFEKTCRERSCVPLRIGEDFDVSRVVQDTSGTVFDYSGVRGLQGLKTRLIGGYQAENAGLAVAATEQLGHKGVAVGDEEVRRALHRAKWPGRLDIVSRRPLLVLDGSHNPEGVRTTVTTLTDLGLTPMTFVVGCMKDKDVMGILRAVSPAASRLVLTQVANKRAATADDLGSMAREEYGGEIAVIPRSGDALEFALSNRSGSGVCAIGSLYLVGEAMQWMERRRRQDRSRPHKV